MYDEARGWERAADSLLSLTNHALTEGAQFWNDDEAPVAVPLTTDRCPPQRDDPVLVVIGNDVGRSCKGCSKPTSCCLCLSTTTSNRLSCPLRQSCLFQGLVNANEMLIFLLFNHRCISTRLLSPLRPTYPCRLDRAHASTSTSTPSLYPLPPSTPSRTTTPSTPRTRTSDLRRP